MISIRSTKIALFISKNVRLLGNNYSTDNAKDKPLQSYFGNKRKLTDKQKKMLVFTKVYEKFEDVPDYVDPNVIRQGRDIKNIYACIFISIFLLLSVFIVHQINKEVPPDENQYNFKEKK